LMLDFHGFAFYRLDNSIFAFRWMHARSSWHFHFRSAGSRWWSLPWDSLPLALLIGLLFYHSILE
jgi:hypothetical protein